MKILPFIALRYIGLMRGIGGKVSFFSYFSFFGIMVSVAVLILVISVMDGFREELMERVLSINGDISISSDINKIVEYDVIDEYLQEHKILKNNYKYILPVINNSSFLKSMHGGLTGIVIKGMSYDNISKLLNVEELLPNEIIVGTSLANDLLLSVGDKVEIYSHSTMSTIIGNIPRTQVMKVSKVMDFGMTEYNSILVYIGLRDVQELFNFNNAVTDIEIHLNKHDMAKDLSSILSNDLGIHALPWQESKGYYLSILNTEKNVMLLILFLIMLIAVFNIVSGLMMLVEEKKSGIALLKVMGMNDYNVAKLFLICGGLLGLIGTVTGIMISGIIVFNIELLENILRYCIGEEVFKDLFYFFDHLPVQWSWKSVMMVSGIAITSSVCAAVYPAICASRHSPAMVLRYI